MARANRRKPGRQDGAAAPRAAAPAAVAASAQHAASPRSAPPAGSAARADTGGVDWPLVLVVTGVGAAVWICIRIAMQDFIFGSRAGGWFHPYNRSFSSGALVLFAGVAAVAAVLAWLADREIGRLGRRPSDGSRPAAGRAMLRREAAVVVGWFVAAAPLQLLLRGRSRPLEAIILSDDANSFWTPALRYGALDFLEHFLEIARKLPQHAGSNMPGKVLLYDLLQQLTVSPSAIAWILLGLSNLGGVFLYFIVRDLFADDRTGGRRAGVWAMILYFFLPAKLYFFPLLNSVTPALILACLWLHLRYLATGLAAWAVALGVALYVLLLFEPLPLATGFVFAALFFVPSLPCCRTPAAAMRAAGLSVAFAAGGFAVLHVALLAAARFDILSCFVHQLGEAQKFNLHAARPYGTWAVQNLVDFFVSTGPALLVVAAGGTVLALRDGWRSPAFLFGSATALTLAALDLAGVNRGETHRLWIFLTAFPVVVAAVLLARMPGISPFAAVLATLVLQVAVTLDVIGFM